MEDYFTIIDVRDQIKRVWTGPFGLKLSVLGLPGGGEKKSTRNGLLG